MESLPQLAKRFAILKSQAEFFEHRAKALRGMLAEMTTVLHDAMIDEGTAEIRVSAVAKEPDGSLTVLFEDRCDRIVRPEEKFKAYIKDENKERTFEWFRSNGHGGMVKTVIESNSLNAWIAKQKENNQILPPEEIMSVFSVKQAKVTRARSGAKK